MKKKGLGDLAGYILPIILGLATIATGIQEKKNADRNEELNDKLDRLNEKLNF